MPRAGVSDISVQNHRIPYSIPNRRLGALGHGVRDGQDMKSLRAPAAVAITTILIIGLYSAYTIGGVIDANAPQNVAFALGTADRDVTYCNSQALDIYVPATTATHALPLVIYVHGGGLSAGDKSDVNPLFLNALASAGFAVASLNYRLAPLAKFPAQIEDVKCAIRYLRANTQTYGINGNEFFAFGTSSGGELVALAALIGGHSAFDVGSYSNQSSGLLAAVDMFGPTNLTEPSGYSSSDLFRVFGDNQSAEVLGSPTHFVTANAPPLLIIQGVDDMNVPEAQSIQLYNELRTAGDHTQLILVQNMGHMFEQEGPEPISPSLGQMAQDMVGFFQQYVQGGG
jgi:acetyl esterase/lipase